MSVKASLADLLVSLRGPYTRAQVAAALGRSRQAVGDIESGNCSMARLEWLEDFYGVDFAVVAIDRRTGLPWRPVPAGADSPTAAPGLVSRIEHGAPPALSPSAVMPGERRTDPPALAGERPGVGTNRSGRPVGAGVGGRSGGSGAESAGERRTRPR